MGAAREGGPPQKTRGQLELQRDCGPFRGHMARVNQRMGAFASEGGVGVGEPIPAAAHRHPGQIPTRQGDRPEAVVENGLEVGLPQTALGVAVSENGKIVPGHPGGTRAKSGFFFKKTKSSVSAPGLSHRGPAFAGKSNPKCRHGAPRGRGAGPAP